MEINLISFVSFRNAVSNQIEKLLACNNVLLVTNVDKEYLYRLYLESFPEGTNPIFRERTEHDCQCCKSFIRKMGNVVGVIDDELQSIWDIDTTGIAEEYVIVAAAMSNYVKQSNVDNVLTLDSKTVGVKSNIDSDLNQYDHFHHIMPKMYVVDTPNHPLNLVFNNETALYNSLTLDSSSIEMVLELAETGSLYRGTEKVQMLQT